MVRERFAAISYRRACAYRGETQRASALAGYRAAVTRMRGRSESKHPGGCCGIWDHVTVTADFDDVERLRGELRSFLHVDTPRPTPRVEVLSSSPQDGYVLHSILLVTDDDTIPSLLAVPTGTGPFPAVVVFHQHAGQRHYGKSEVFGIIGDPHQAFGPALAHAGPIVLAPDSIAFEDRRPGGVGTDPRPDDWDQHYNALTRRLVAGDTLMRKVLDDAMAAVSALLARDDVRTDALIALGHSYGGNTSLFLTAVHERIRAGCASGALASYRRKISDGTGIEMAEVIPGFTRRFDMEKVVAAITPRPFFIVSATDDKYSADAAEILDAAAAAIQADRAEQNVSHLRVSGGHALDTERFEAIIDWIVQTATRSPMQYSGVPVTRSHPGPRTTDSRMGSWRCDWPHSVVLALDGRHLGRDRTGWDTRSRWRCSLVRPTPGT